MHSGSAKNIRTRAKSASLPISPSLCHRLIYCTTLLLTGPARTLFSSAILWYAECLLNETRPTEVVVDLLPNAPQTLAYDGSGDLRPSYNLHYTTPRRNFGTLLRPQPTGAKAGAHASDPAFDTER